MPTVILDKPIRSRVKTQDQLKRMENKLSNIEERLLSMEYKFNNTLEQIMEILKQKHEFSIETTDHVSGRIRTTSV